MSGEHGAMQIRTANAAELSDMRTLLAANGLPVEDICTTLIEGFLIIRGARGTIVGSGGLQHLGSSVLLRSLAVTRELRGTGLARRLVARLEDDARALGYEELWLLTTTAERFFAVAGYERASRDDVPAEVRSCTQFAVLCPSTAICMRKRLLPAHCPSAVERPASS
ncbi:arsenic resistance N-acetyltransferase ArsN2 [Paraburkholderia sp. DGU8]